MFWLNWSVYSSLGLLALALRLWTDRRRRTPKSLAINRLQSFGLHVIEQSAAILGYGFSIGRADWSWAGAVEYLMPFLKPGRQSQEEWQRTERTEWIWLARVIVREFDRLDARLAAYGFVFTDDTLLYERFALLDGDVDGVRAALEILDDSQGQVPALKEAIQNVLPERLVPCIVSSVLLVGLTQEIKREPFSTDAVATRSIAAYVSFMEPKFQDYVRRRRKKGKPTDAASKNE